MSNRLTLAARALLGSVLGLLLLGGLVGCSTTPETFEVRIPAGEWQAKTGAVLDDLPQIAEEGDTVLTFSLGETLLVTNEVEHMIGLVIVRPGETVRYTFNQRGDFEGACTLLTGERILIRVT